MLITFDIFYHRVVGHSTHPVGAGRPTLRGQRCRAAGEGRKGVAAHALALEAGAGERLRCWENKEETEGKQKVW